jgi:hypothetical protein
MQNGGNGAERHREKASVHGFIHRLRFPAYKALLRWPISIVIWAITNHAVFARSWLVFLISCALSPSSSGMR